jgi:hypothetical protein
MIGGSKKYEINFDGHQYVIKVKRPLAKKIFGKERHEYLFSFSCLEKKDLNMEESVKELLLFLNPVINRKRYAITDKNPEFERNFELFTKELDKIIASPSKTEEEYITGLIGLLARLRIEKAEIDAQVAKAFAIAHAKKMEKLFANMGPKTPKKRSRNRKKELKAAVSLPIIWEGIEGGRRRWRSQRRRLR